MPSDKGKKGSKAAKANAAKREARLARLRSQEVDDEMDLTIDQPQVCDDAEDVDDVDVDEGYDASLTEQLGSNVFDLSCPVNIDVDADVNNVNDNVNSLEGGLNVGKSSNPLTADYWQKVVGLLSKQELKLLLKQKSLTSSMIMQIVSERASSRCGL